MRKKIRLYYALHKQIYAVHGVLRKLRMKPSMLSFPFVPLPVPDRPQVLIVPKKEKLLRPKDDALDDRAWEYADSRVFAPVYR
jgi:hypothetical protein